MRRRPHKADGSLPLKVRQTRTLDRALKGLHLAPGICFGSSAPACCHLIRSI
jgi:hypothetical protein